MSYASFQPLTRVPAEVQATKTSGYPFGVGWPVGNWPISSILDRIEASPCANALPREPAGTVNPAGVSACTPSVRWDATTYSIGRRTFCPTELQNSVELSSA